MPADFGLHLPPGALKFGSIFALWTIMPRIRVESLKVGLIVAADVKNMDGMLLMPKGASLGERQIGILQAWGVTEVEVEASEGLNEEVDPLARLPAELLAKITQEIKSFFWDPDESNPVFVEVFKQLLARKARQIGAGKR